MLGPPDKTGKQESLEQKMLPDKTGKQESLEQRMLPDEAFLWD